MKTMALVKNNRNQREIANANERVMCEYSDDTAQNGRGKIPEKALAKL